MSVVNRQTLARRERGWKRVVASGAPFTAYCFKDASGLSLTSSRRTLNAWADEGKLEVVASGKGQMTTFRKAPEPTGPVEKTRIQRAHQNMWVAMRRSTMFTASDVLGFTNAAGVSAHRDEVEGYIRFLVTAGYVTRDRRKSVDPRYKLVKQTGPRAPEPHFLLSAYDPNLDRTTYVDGIEVPA